MDRKITGVIPPVLTAFDRKGNFDEGAQREIISYLINYVQGFYPCGSYGSGVLMSSDERKRVAEVVIDEVGGRVPVIVHTGSAATRTVIDLSRHAEQVGATAVAAVPPIYYGHAEPEVYRHFSELVNAISIPVFIYNNPKTTGVSVTAELLQRLVEIGVAGVKDSSFDILVFYSYLRKIKKAGFIPIIGSEALILPAVVMGAHATVSGLANAVPEPVLQLFKAAADGDLVKAVPLQTKVSTMRDIMHFGPTLPMIQAILCARGINAGYPRLPFVPPDDSLLRRAIDALRSLDVSFP